MTLVLMFHYSEVNFPYWEYDKIQQKHFQPAADKLLQKAHTL